MQRLIILALTILLLPIFSQAQKWKRNRKEYSFGLGVTNFLGDLGGRNQKGTNGFMDFEHKSTRFAASLGYRYQLERDWFIKGNLIYARLSGNDNLTLAPGRAKRKLNFRTDVVELSAQVEYMIIKQKTGALYRLKGVRGRKWFKFEVYALLGVGAIWYDPKSEKDGDWHRLAPLNTEGQGQPGGPSDYSGFTAVIPYGLGIRRSITSGARARHYGTWSIGFELTMRKTFSDYIDDVSTDYYESEGTGVTGAGYGVEATYFSDPSGRYINGGFGEDQQRGDPKDKDAYMLGVISVNYKPARRRRNLPKF